jgi:hypothetical protein
VLGQVKDAGAASVVSWRLGIAGNSRIAGGKAEMRVDQSWR